MTTLKWWQVIVFVGTLALIAFIINGTRERLGEGASPPPGKPPNDEAAEREKYKGRYLNTKVSRKAGVNAVVVAVVTDDDQLNGSLARVVSRRFSSQTIETHTSFFTPEFVSDGLFNSAFAGSRKVLGDLDLANSLDALLLARQTVQYSTNASLENIITANMHLEMMALPLAGTIEVQTWKFAANGAGFTQADARKLAEERLIKEIVEDNKMSLDQILQKK